MWPFKRKTKTQEQLWKELWHAHLDELGVATVRQLIRNGDPCDVLTPPALKEWADERSGTERSIQ